MGRGVFDTQTVFYLIGVIFVMYETYTELNLLNSIGCFHTAVDRLLLLPVVCFPVFTPLVQFGIKCEWLHTK